MNAQELAQAVVHWLEFERLCGRKDLLSEAALRQPIGQFLFASQKFKVAPEEDYPARRRTKPKAIDFCLKRPNGDTKTHAIESKLISGSRDFTQEIFDDLYRLQNLKWQQQEPCERWLLLAGTWAAIEQSIVKRQSNPLDGSARISTFGGILSLQPNAVTHHHIYTAQETSPTPILEAWREAAEKLGKQEIASSIRTKLMGLYPHHRTAQTFSCFVWRVSAPQGQGFRNLSDLPSPPAKTTRTSIAQETGPSVASS